MPFAESAMSATYIKRKEVLLRLGFFFLFQINVYSDALLHIKKMRFLVFNRYFGEKPKIKRQLEVNRKPRGDEHKNSLLSI